MLLDDGYSADSLSRLSALSSSLTRLNIDMCSMSSTALAGLTRLQHLYCIPFSADTCAAVTGALPHLTGLTCLVSTWLLNSFGGWQCWCRRICAHIKCGAAHIKFSC